MPDITFDLCPEYEFGEDYRRRGKQSPARGGFVQRGTRWTEGDLRTFTLRWRMANAAVVARLRSLWTLALGPVHAMSYTPPNGTAVNVRFKDQSLTITPRSGIAWNVEVALEEVR